MDDLSQSLLKKKRRNRREKKATYNAETFFLEILI